MSEWHVWCNNAANYAVNAALVFGVLSAQALLLALVFRIMGEGR